MERLSPKQKEMLQAILDFTLEHKYPPTIGEICRLTGLQSPSVVQGHLERLKLKGLITWEPSLPRTVQVIDKDVI